MALIFHWYPLSPPTQAVWSVLETLKVPYQKKFVDIVQNRDNTKPEYLAINPEGTVPYIQDGDFGLGESRAIICYLCNKYEDKNKENQLYPTGARARARVDCALNQDFQYFINLREYFNMRGVLFNEPKEIGPLEERWCGIVQMLDGLERRLQTTKYVAADHLTVADFSALSCAGGLEILFPSVKRENYPRLYEWKDEMESLPMYKVCYGDSFTKFKMFYDHTVEENKKKLAG